MPKSEPDTTRAVHMIRAAITAPTGRPLSFADVAAKTTQLPMDPVLGFAADGEGFMRSVPRDSGVPGAFGLTARPKHFAGSGEACHYAFLVYDLLGPNQLPPPPTRAEFRERMISPNYHTKFATGVTVEPSETAFLEGSVIGATYYEIWVMITDATAPDPSEYGNFPVATLQVLARPYDNHSFGWAPQYEFPVVFNNVGDAIHIGDVYGFILSSCKGDGLGDYLFRIVPEEGITTFNMHVGIAFKGFFI